MNGFGLEWWVSILVGTIIGGFLINIAATKILPRIDSLWEKRSDSRRAKNTAKQLVFEVDVARVIKSDHNILRAYSTADFHALRSAFFGLACIMLSAIPISELINQEIFENLSLIDWFALEPARVFFNFFMLLFALLTLTLYFKHHIRPIYLRSVLTEADRLINLSDDELPFSAVLDR